MYKSGGSYTNNSGVTLYAVWKLSYTKPRISNFSVTRCDGNGIVTDEGTFALVKFSWSTDRTVSGIEIITNSSEVGSITFTASGTSGTVSEIIGDGNFILDSTYSIYVIVRDSGGAYGRSLPLHGNVFPIDVMHGENGTDGVAFGKPAELEGYADFAFKPLLVNNIAIHGRDLNGDPKEAFNPQNENGNTVLGWGNYNSKVGNTNVYGFDLNFGVSNQPNPSTFRPYRRKGDSFTITLRTAGYVTNGSKDVSFWIPMSMPIIGSPTVTVESGNGFTLRQNDKYTHGSTASASVHPTSYEATATYANGIYVKAVFSDTTNVTNNDTIGIYWHGTVTFS
jgi:hypothetical protein